MESKSTFHGQFRYMSKITRTQNLGVSQWRNPKLATIGPESCLEGVPRGLGYPETCLVRVLNTVLHPSHVPASSHFPFPPLFLITLPSSLLSSFLLPSLPFSAFSLPNSLPPKPLIHSPLSCGGKFWVAQPRHIGFFGLRNSRHRCGLDILNKYFC